MVRRLKEDLREVARRVPQARVVRQIDIDGLPADAPELRLSALLDAVPRAPRAAAQGETKRKQAAAGLLVSGLQQRLLSSIEAFARTLRVHRRTVERQWEAASAGPDPRRGQPALLDLLGRGFDDDDDRADARRGGAPAEEEAQVEAATRRPATLPADDGTSPSEERLLDEMTEVAEAARDVPDARVR